MKERYIKEVRRALGRALPRKEREEILRDLGEIFSSGAEHGETERQVAERLGSPGDFVRSTMEQLGLDSGAGRRKRGLLSALTALLITVAAFSVYAASRAGGPPKDAIGYADAMTTIRMEGAFGIDLAPLVLAVGVTAAAAAAIQIVRTLRDRREK